MAQQDTGLGWSAKAEWLMQGTGAVAEINGFTMPGYNLPLPITGGSAQDIINNGILIVDSRGYEIYASATEENTFINIYISGVRLELGFLCPSTTGKVYWVSKSKSSGDAGTVNVGQYWRYAGASHGVDFYYYEFGYSNWDYDMTTTMPQLGSGSSYRVPYLTALDYTSAQFTKTNAGYAVACIAKWKTSNGVTITTPILISTVSEYTDMDTAASGYNLAKLNILHAGVRFYMAFWDITDSPPMSSSLQVFDYSAPERPALTLENVFKFIASTDYAEIRVINAPDPYEEEGAGSGEEGGDGEDLEDDEMGISHHAIPAAINTGFCRIYCPTEQQLRDLSNFLWSAQYDLTAVKKLFANPMDSVLGLSAVPLNLSGANAAVYLGGVDTKMSFPMVSYQSYQVPMGAITVEKRWGSYLDYDPYTRFSIFLPFIGFKDLSADDIMGKQIILDYDVDILSGACTARLQAGGNVLYQWSGQCSIQLPVTASNWNQVFQGATSAALSAGLAVATGSAGPVLAGALAAEGVQAIMGKPRIERGGTASGAAGWMGGLTPYLVRVTPEAIIPSDQNKFIGYPAFSSISLGALTGYNEISSIHLEGIPATGAELEELESILKGGVIF